MSNNINWHVSYEEAEASIHNAVNQIYAHNMNDPTMSQEEAYQSTAESAEIGLTYLAEFQQAQAQEVMQESATENAQSGLAAEDGLGTEGGVEGDGLGDGLDGGDDGGVDGGVE